MCTTFDETDYSDFSYLLMSTEVKTAGGKSSIRFRNGRDARETASLNLEYYRNLTATVKHFGHRDQVALASELDQLLENLMPDPDKNALYFAYADLRAQLGQTIAP